MTKKQVKGLLDYMALKPDEDWELSPYSEDYVFGMGMCASRDAIRWAFKGYMLEMRQSMTTFKRNVGRKKLHEYESVDCQRAMRIWLFVNKSRPELDSLKNRHLIAEMQKLGERDQTIKRLFPRDHTRLESSVSNGKAVLSIDKNWKSKVCEKLMAN